MTTTFTAPVTRSRDDRQIRREVLTLPQRERDVLDVSAFRGPVKPEWNRDAKSYRSNTYGVGRAAVPSRAQRRIRARIAEPAPEVFDNVSSGLMDRWADRAERFVTSTGGLTVALSSIVLTLGLSPLVL